MTNVAHYHSQHQHYHLRQQRRSKRFFFSFLWGLDNHFRSTLSTFLVLWLASLDAAPNAAAMSSPSSTNTIPSSSSSAAAAASKQYIHPYVPPVWAKNAFRHVPQGRLKLAHLPTPLYPLSPPPTTTASTDSAPTNWLSLLHQHNIALWIKRDDMTGGLELGGNKIRKLEFLLAEALEQRHDAVITIGGIQSNHARATAAAARMVGLQPHLILRTKEPAALVEQPSSSLVGNLLVNRLVGSHIYTCTPGEYGRIGSDELVRRVGRHVQEELGQSPYLIPVGGSNALGSWGYVQAVDELLQQWNELHQGDTTTASSSSPSSLDHIVLACGSGGTAAGVCLGIALAFGALSEQDDSTSTRTKIPQIHAVGVCDDPDYFYHYVAQIATDMGLIVPTTTAPSVEEFIRQHLTVYQGKGLGYAVSTAEELEFVANLARDTGVVLDPVYTGKALYHFVQHELVPKLESSSLFGNSNILFWHTGGGLGLFDKADDVLPTLESSSLIQRLNVYGTADGDGINVSEKT